MCLRFLLVFARYINTRINKGYDLQCSFVVELVEHVWYKGQQLAPSFLLVHDRIQNSTVGLVIGYTSHKSELALPAKFDTWCCSLWCKTDSVRSWLTRWAHKTYPNNQALLTLRTIVTYRLSSWKKLKKYYSKCIDINLVINLSIHEIFGSQVTAVKHSLTEQFIRGKYNYVT